MDIKIPTYKEIPAALNQIFSQILLLTYQGVMSIPIQAQTSDLFCLSERALSDKSLDQIKKCSKWGIEDFLRENSPPLFYILNYSPYHRQVQVQSKLALSTVIFRKSQSLHNSMILPLQFCARSETSCVWLPPNSLNMVEFIIDSEKFQNQAKFIASAHFSQISRRFSNHQKQYLVENQEFKISFRIRQRRGQLKLSPPQIQFSSLLPGLVHQQVIMLHSSYGRKLTVQSVTCNDIRVSYSLLTQEFQKNSPSKQFLKVSINLTKSLLSPGLARLEQEMDPFSSPTLDEIFTWKRLRHEWEFLKQKNQLHLSATVNIKFDNEIQLTIPLRGEFKLPALTKENAQLLFGQRAMKQGTDISEWNSVIFTNPSKLYIGLSLWLAPPQFADLNQLEHQEFYISQYDPGLNARMLRGRIQKAIRNLIPYCQERPAELQKQLHKQKLGFKQSCMEDIKDELGLDFQGLHVLEVQTNSIEMNIRERLHREPPQIQRMNRFDISHEDAHFSQSPGGLGLTIRGASFFSREQDFKINLPFQEQLLKQAHTDLFFNSHNPRHMVLAPGQSLTLEDVLFYYPTSESFNATLFVKNNYSLFDSIPLIAKPIEFSLVVTHLGSINCSQTCQMQYTPSKSRVVLFQITLDQIEHHSSYPAVVEWNDNLQKAPVARIVPDVLKTRKILRPLVRRKLVIENQSEMALRVLKIELSGGCANELFWMSPCPILEPFEVERGGSFELMLSSRADSVLLQGYTQFYIQTDKMDFFLGVVYQAQEAVIRARQQEQLNIDLPLYKALFLATLVGIGFATGLALHGARIQKQEAQQHSNKFWNMVAVNQEANAEPLFHISPGLLFEEFPEIDEERNTSISSARKKKQPKKTDKKQEKQEKEQAYNSQMEEPRKKRDPSPESVSTTSGTTSARKKKEQRYSSVEPSKKVSHRKKSTQSETVGSKQEQNRLEEEGWNLVGKRTGKRTMTEPKTIIKSPRADKPKKSLGKKSELKKKQENERKQEMEKKLGTVHKQELEKKQEIEKKPEQEKKKENEKKLESVMKHESEIKKEPVKKPDPEQKIEMIETEVVPFKPPRYTDAYKGMSGWTVRYQKKKREPPAPPTRTQNEESYPRLGEASDEREIKPKIMPPVSQTKSLFNFSSPVLTAQQSFKDEKSEEVNIKKEKEYEEEEKEGRRCFTQEDGRVSERQGSIWASIIPTKRKNSASDSGRKWGPGGEGESEGEEATSEEDGGELLSELRETSEKVERHESGF